MNDDDGTNIFNLGDVIQGSKEAGRDELTEVDEVLYNVTVRGKRGNLMIKEIKGMLFPYGEHFLMIVDYKMGVKFFAPLSSIAFIEPKDVAHG